MKIITQLIALLLAAGGAAAFAPEVVAHEEGMHELRFVEHHDMMRGRFDALDLTDAQHDRIRALRREGQQALREQVKTLRETREELSALARADAFDEHRAQELAARHAQAMTAIESARVRTQFEIRQVLDQEQREIWDAHAPEFRQRFKFRD